MSSLPQGWHGIPVPTKKSSFSTAATTVPTPIRKKWNSPMANEVPRSKLPAYKPLVSRQNRIPATSAHSARSLYKSSCSELQEDKPTTPAKISPNKDLQNEIVKLKKELATVKTENSILKVKVRRVDDENAQKSRQIEKLRVELKAVQKVESTSNKKSKDSELLLLRQKCLRLEGAIKDKDLALNTVRKLYDEALKLEGINHRSIIQSEAVDADELKHKLEDTKALGKQSSTSASLSRSSHSKTEVAKLREIIHKLEHENQELQQQMKDRGEEIRRLKMHLRSQTYTKSSQTSSATSVLKTSSTSQSSLKVPIKPPESKPPLHPKPPQGTSSQNVKKLKMPASQTKKENKSVPTSTLKKQDSIPRSIIVSKKRKSEPLVNGNSNSQSPSKKLNEMQPKLPVTEVDETFIVSQSLPTKPGPSADAKNNIDGEVQSLRENLAAKKIQRGWRDHQKKKLKKDESHPTLQKALTFIVTSVKHHKMRKDKLNMLQKRKYSSPRMTMNSEGPLVEAIQAATRSIWQKEMSISN